MPRLGSRRRICRYSAAARRLDICATGDGRQCVNIQLASDIVGSLMLIAGVGVAWGRRGLLTIGIAVAIPTLIFRWTAWASPGRFRPVWNDGWTIAAILIIGYILLAQVFPAGPINAVRIQGAVAAYLLLIVAYAHGYQITGYFNAS